MKKIKTILITICSAVLIILPVVSVKAQLLSNSEMLRKNSSDFAGAAGFSNISIGGVVANVIAIVLSVLALIFLVLTILAGFKWMNAGGNDEDVKKAQTSLKNAIIGLIIVLASFAITYFIFNTLPFSGGSPNSIPNPL